MKPRRIGPSLILVTLLIASPSAADTNPDTDSAAAKHSQSTTLGRTGEIELDDDTNVGFRSLAPGRYQVQHVTTEKGHAVRFSPVGGHVLLHRPVVVECTTETLKEPAPSTLVRLRLGTYRMELVKLYIKGESAAHVF